MKVMLRTLFDNDPNRETPTGLYFGRLISPFQDSPERPGDNESLAMESQDITEPGPAPSSCPASVVEGPAKTTADDASKTEVDLMTLEVGV